MIALDSADGKDGLACHPVGCSMYLGHSSDDALYVSVDYPDSHEWVGVRSARNWLVIVSPDGALLTGELIR
jgi:hypothetical protein